MADPHLAPELDGFDRLTVRLYRLALLVGAVALGLVGWGMWTRDTPLTLTGRWWISLAAAVGVWNLHLYDRRLRWLLALLVLGGLLSLNLAPLLLDDPAWWAREVGLGLHLAALAALVVKEGFCFRLWASRLTPLLMAASFAGHALGYRFWTAVLFALAALALLVVALQKAVQPLSHDIGDRARYEV